MTTLLLQFWPYLAAAGIGLLALWKAYAAGKKATALERERERLKARDIADQVDNDIGGMEPSKAREELKKWSR